LIHDGLKFCPGGSAPLEHEIDSFLALTLELPQTSQTNDSAQFKRLRLLMTYNGAASHKSLIDLGKVELYPILHAFPTGKNRP